MLLELFDLRGQLDYCRSLSHTRLHCTLSILKSPLFQLALFIAVLWELFNFLTHLLQFNFLVDFICNIDHITGLRYRIILLRNLYILFRDYQWLRIHRLKVLLIVYHRESCLVWNRHNKRHLIIVARKVQVSFIIKHKIIKP